MNHLEYLNFTETEDKRIIEINKNGTVTQSPTLRPQRSQKVESRSQYILTIGRHLAHILEPLLAP